MRKEDPEHPSNYLNDLEEWQENQYNPGYWTGGNIPPHLKYPKKPLGILFIIMGVFSILLVTVAVIQDLSLDNVFGNILGLFMALLFLIAGIRIIRLKR